MKCSCGGNIEKVAYNCNWDIDTELWDCMCDKCGHKIIGFNPECPNCHHDSLVWLTYHEMIESGDGYVSAMFCCDYCSKEFLKAVRVDEWYGN